MQKKVKKIIFTIRVFCFSCVLYMESNRKASDAINKKINFLKKTAMNNIYYTPANIDADLMESAETSSLVEMIATLAMDDADFYSEI